MAKVAQNQLPLLKLDKNFLAVARFIWRSLKTVFTYFRYIADRTLALLGYQKVHRTDFAAELEDADPIYRESSLDKRAFQNFGGIRWVSDLSLAQIEHNSRFDFPEPQILRIRYGIKGEKKERTAEFEIYGELQNHELDLVGDVLASLFEELKILNNPIRVIHFVSDLGRFLNSQGVPQDKVPGFTLDPAGTLIALEDMGFEESVCYRFFRRVLEDEQNRETTIKRAREALWNQQDTIVQRISELREYTPPTSRHRHGSLRARQIIDLDTPIKDGIHLGWPAREAIAVDSQGERLNAAYNQLLFEVRKFKEPLGLGFEERLMRTAVSLVQRLLPRNTPEALKEFRDRNRIAQDEEIPLDMFLAEETGDGEHQALLAAYFLERIAKESPEYLSGNVSVDRSWFPGESHCWVRYVSGKKNIYVVDPKKNLVIRLDDHSKPRWPYERPTDVSRPRKQRPITL